MLSVIRSSSNPILRPNWEHAFEAAATFNGCPVKTGSGKSVSLLYRALSEPQFYEGVELMLSVIGKAESKDGVNWTKPELGLVEFNGNKKNNICLIESEVHSMTRVNDFLSVLYAPNETNAALEAFVRGL